MAKQTQTQSFGVTVTVMWTVEQALKSLQSGKRFPTLSPIVEFNKVEQSAELYPGRADFQIKFRSGDQVLIQAKEARGQKSRYNEKNARKAVPMVVASEANTQAEIESMLAQTLIRVLTDRTNAIIGESGARATAFGRAGSPSPRQNRSLVFSHNHMCF